MGINRTGNLNLHVQHKFGKEHVILLCEWEGLVKKMAHFHNHRRFILRCVNTGITPVNCNLKNIIETPRSYQIIGKAEKQLLNEGVKIINQTLSLCGLKRDMALLTTALKTFRTGKPFWKASYLLIE